MNSAQESTSLDVEHSDLWGKFPGRLKTTLKHSFSFFDYSKVAEDPKANLTLNKTISFKESVSYEDFVKSDDQISFKVKRNYELLTKNEDEKVTLPSFGLYEYLHTVSNPSSYQIGISSIMYLTEFVEAYQNNFERQMFIMANSRTFLQEEQKICDTFFKGISQEKCHFVYNHKLYGFNKLDLIFKWVKLLGDPTEIQATKWLKTILKLTDLEIDSVLGEQSFLNKYYEQFKKPHTLIYSGYAAYVFV